MVQLLAPKPGQVRNAYLHSVRYKEDQTSPKISSDSWCRYGKTTLKICLILFKWSKDVEKNEYRYTGADEAMGRKKISPRFVSFRISDVLLPVLF